MSIAPPAGNFSFDEIVAARVDQASNFGFQQRRIDFLTDAELLASEKRRRNRVSEHQSGHEIDDRDSHFGGLAVRHAGDAH